MHLTATRMPHKTHDSCHALNLRAPSFCQGLSLKWTKRISLSEFEGKIFHAHGRFDIDVRQAFIMLWCKRKEQAVYVDDETDPAGEKDFIA